MISGLRTTRRPPLSSKLYSCCVISSPALRMKSASDSSTGKSTSSKAIKRDTSLKLSKSQVRRRMSSGGKSLVPRGGFNSTTPTEEAEEEEEESPWVSTEEEDEEEETQRRRRAGRSGRSRRRWRSDADDADAIHSRRIGGSSKPGDEITVGGFVLGLPLRPIKGPKQKSRG